MSDTKSDSDDSVVFVGVSENIKVQVDVHPKPETSPDITIVPETPDFKRMKLLPNNGEPSSIKETEGNYQNIYNNIYIYIYIYIYILYIYIHTYIYIYIYTEQKKTFYLITTTF